MNMKKKTEPDDGLKPLKLVKNKQEICKVLTKAHKINKITR